MKLRCHELGIVLEALILFQTQPGYGQTAQPRPEPVVGAPVDVSAFRYARRIPASKSGFDALRLDAAVLAHSNLSDLRIVGADGRQIPYLLEKLDEPLSVNLPPLEEFPAPGPDARARSRVSGLQSYYYLRFPYDNLPESRLIITTAGRVFERHVRVLIEQSASERGAPWSEQLAEAAWSHANPDTPAPALALRLPALKTAQALLVVEEGDNSPLSIAAVRLLLPAYQMRFFRAAEGDLTLLYGNKDIGAPRYDLALLSSGLSKSAAEEISPGPESSAAVAESGAAQKQARFFWIMLVAAVVILLVMIVRLVTKSEAGGI